LFYLVEEKKEKKDLMVLKESEVEKVISFCNLKKKLLKIKAQIVLFP